MKALVIKEFKSIFCSSVGVFFTVSYLAIIGLLLWFFDGDYNILTSGYASLSSFFSLSLLLFSVLLPALTMRLFSEEKRTETADILRARPISFFWVYASKFIASFTFVLITLLPTVIYIYTIWQLANPVGNIDLESIIASYVSLLLLVAVFISIGLFASSITKNQIIALITGVFLCCFSLYGFELLAQLFLSGKIQATLSSFGLIYHYSLMQRGVIHLNDIFVVFNYLFVFYILAIIFYDKKRQLIKYLIVFFILNIFFFFLPNIRFDFTADKRYTLSDYSKNLLNKSEKEKQSFKAIIYLEGNLNAGFQRLQTVTNNLLTDFNRYGGNSIDIIFSNPYQTYSSTEKMYKSMEEKGMQGIVLNETDREGKVSQKMLYPYVELTDGSDTLIVSLLKNIQANTADDNLNASIENLEFEFIDAIRLLNQQEAKTIAFIEGHGELAQENLFDAEDVLSKYYFVNRGNIGANVSELDTFDAIIIAGSKESFSEIEKYIIDQYIMNGGKVLWLLDGAYYSHTDLVRSGYSASMKNETNLDDLLFSYGIRINADFVQDTQCASVYLTTEKGGGKTLIPNYYEPYLMPSIDHPITRNIKDIKARFVSSIDILNTSNTKKEILLTSSAHTHLQEVPQRVDFDIQKVQNAPNYFNQSYIITAVSIDGIFNSAFTNRMIPLGVVSNRMTNTTSEKTKMVVVSSSSLIRNEVRRQGGELQILPMGYDLVADKQFGNKEFIVNAVNWLTDDDGWMELRNKGQSLYILNKNKVYENRDKYAILNIGFPILFVLLIMGIVVMYRKKKYEY